MVKVVLNNNVQDTEPWFRVAVLTIYLPTSIPRRKRTYDVRLGLVLQDLLNHLFEFLSGDSKK